MATNRSFIRCTVHPHTAKQFSRTVWAGETTIADEVRAALSDRFRGMSFDVREGLSGGRAALAEDEVDELAMIVKTAQDEEANSPSWITFDGSVKAHCERSTPPVPVEMIQPHILAARIGARLGADGAKPDAAPVDSAADLLPGASPRRGRLSLQDSEFFRTRMLVILRQHPTQKDFPKDLAKQVGVGESTVRRWLEEIEAAYREDRVNSMVND